MTSLRQSFRTWWQPPGRTRDRVPDRQVTSLELFYDLVYVALIAELARALAGDVDISGLASYAFLFVTVWWAWLNGTMYHDLHGNNDVRTRVFTFLQMSAVASMAVFARNALGEGSAGFALSYAAFLLILTYLWWRTGVHDSDHRPLSQPYALTFLVATLLFTVSVLVPVPWRFHLWGLALVLSLLLPLVTLNLGRRDPRVQAEIDRTTTVSPAAVRRFGRLTNIVLGQVVAGVVRGVAGHHYLSPLTGGTAALGMLIAIGLWWVYFDLVSHHLPRPGNVTVSGWMYLHLPVTVGVAAVGAAIANVVAQAGAPLPPEVRWLLVGAMATVLLSVALLARTIQVPEEDRPVHGAAGRALLLLGFAIVLLGPTSLGAIPLLLALSLLLLGPAFYGFRTWLQLQGAEAGTPT
jgi:low temperature requirement protein LtrA